MSPESVINQLIQSSLFIAGLVFMAGIFISIPLGLVLIILKQKKTLGWVLVLVPLFLLMVILGLFIIASLV